MIRAVITDVIPKL